MKPKLVKNWRDGLKWFSVQANIAAGSIVAVWVMLPEDMKSSVPSEWVMGATVAAIVLGTIGRFVDQGGDDA